METQHDHMILSPLAQEVQFFLVDRASRGRSDHTIRFYQVELRLFTQFLGNLAPGDLTPGLLREYFLKLGKTRSKGGVHASYRAVKAFLNWYAEEYDLPSNPITKVKLALPKQDPLPGVPLDRVQRIIDHCTGPNRLRDRAILWFLVDSGVRKHEFTSLKVEDVDLMTGAVEVKQGKGDKPRTTFIGGKTRRELTRYLRTRGDLNPWDPLFATESGESLADAGLRQIIRRRSEDAGVECPGIHDFRRTFALESLRNGCDIFSLMRMMGHSSPAVLYRYLALVTGDIAQAHRGSSPVDRHRPAGK